MTVTHEETFGAFQVNTKMNDIDDGHHYFEAGQTHAWFLYGQLHRKNAPAIIWKDGSEDWFFCGKPHREDGPAIETMDGFKEWSLHGEYLTFDAWIDKLAEKDLDHATMMKLKWG